MNPNLGYQGIKRLRMEKRFPKGIKSCSKPNKPILTFGGLPNPPSYFYGANHLSLNGATPLFEYSDVEFIVAILSLGC